jgi:hypothetical protein
VHYVFTLGYRLLPAALCNFHVLKKKKSLYGGARRLPGDLGSLPGPWAARVAMPAALQ